MSSAGKVPEGASRERDGRGPVGVVGLGYVGLPVAVAFAQAGRQVVGIDLAGDRIAALNRGESWIEDVPSETLAALGEKLSGSTDYTALAGCEEVVICVPTPLTGSREPDLSYLKGASRELARVLEPGQLVVLESTTYPGATRDLIRPALEREDRQAGTDFHLAFSPERIDPGRTDYTIRTTPKLVGGLTPACTDRAVTLYGQICDTVVPLSTPETAELAKLLENIFRSVNIALVNELAQLCVRLGVDVWEVIDAAATKPFGYMRFDPGPGMGGHCLPVDPFYLAFKAREHGFYPEFVELAGKINQSQPLFCVNRIERTLNGNGLPVKDTRILLVGVSYKGGVGDVRESPSLPIISLLKELGARIEYHDPYVPELPEQGLTATTDLDRACSGAALTVIVTAHPGIDWERVVERSRHVLDLRGVTRSLGPRPDLTLL